MSSRTLKGLTALTLSTSLLAFSAPAMAQLDEIIVTAQKREQSLQDVPISISAFDVEALETKRIDGLEDIAQFSPGVYTTPNPADETGVRVNIRGIGTFDPQIGQDSRTAIYVDGVYYGRTQGLAFDSPDLGRVEILKGPQGTLYGRNTVAGAVNLISVAPDPTQYSGALDVEVGNFDHRRLNGHINVPITDSAALRISGLFSDTDGWVENTGLGENFGGTERFGGRAALRVEAAPQLTFDLAADYTNTQSTPLFQQPLAGTNNPAAFFAPAFTVSEDTGRQDEVNSFSNIEEGETEIFGVSLITNYEVNETDDLKVTLAYREADSERFVALAPTANPAILNGLNNGPNPFLGGINLTETLAALPAIFASQGASLRPDFATQFDGSTPDVGLFVSPIGGAPTLDGHKQLSAELTYTGSALDGRIDYTAGLFYFDEETANGSNPLNPNGNLADANAFFGVLGALTPIATTVGLADGLAGAQAGLPLIQGGLAQVQGGLAQVQGGIAQVQGGLAATPVSPQTQPIIDGLNAQLAELQMTEAGLLMTEAELLGNLAATQGALAFLPGALAGSIGPTSAALAEARSTTSNGLFIDTQAFAIYGEATFHVNDDFRITAGLRYSDDRKDGIGQAASAFFLDNIDLTGNIIAPNFGEADTDSLDPSVILEYDYNEDILLYASYKESFRSGGFNATSTSLPGADPSDFIFGSEDITAYEAGFKADLLDSRFRLNVAGYFYDFTDFQTTVSASNISAIERAVVNTDQEIYGVDVEAVFALTEDLILNGSYAFVDGNQDPIVNTFLEPNEISMQDGLQGSPENSFTVGLDYNRELAGNKNIFGAVSYSYKDAALAIPQQAASDEIGFSSQNLVSGRIGMGFDIGGKEASISLWGANLLDDEYTIDGLPFNTFAFNTAVFGQPRTYGVAAGVKF